MHSLISRHLPLFGGLLVVLISAGFVRLGFWQLERAGYKQELYAQYLANTAREVVPLAMLPSSEPDRTLGRHVIAQGGYLPDRQILLDNQSLGGRPGYLVFTPFRPAGEPHEAILVNRGWIPLSASRDAVSLPPLSAGVRSVRGELGRPPVSGLRLRGSDLIETLDGGIRRVQVIDYSALGGALGLSLQPRVLLLDPAAPEGFERAWSPPGNDAGRHRSYAFQWFALAGALVAIYLTLFSQTTPMNTDTTAAQRRARLTMLAVVAAFVLPIFLAWLLTSGLLPWMPKGRLNYGSLIDPTIDLSGRRFLDEDGSVASFDRRFGEWTIATILPDPCEAECRGTLDDAGRIRLALREEMARVHVAAIVDHARGGLDLGAREAEAGVEIYRTSVDDLIAALRAARVVPEGESGFDRILLIDHLSRAMMIYPHRPDLGGVTKDVKRLLRASKTD